MKERKATGQKMKTRTKKGFCQQRMKPSGLLTKRKMNGMRQMLPAEKSKGVEKYCKPSFLASLKIGSCQDHGVCAFLYKS